MRYKIRMLIETLIGIPVSDNIESRIFNSVALFIAATLVLTASADYMFGLPLLLTMLMLATAGLALFLYYLARVKKKLNLAVILFGIIGNAVFIINFYYNSGISGPSIFAFILLLFLLMAISPKQQYAFWMALNSSVVCALLAISYHHPNLIKNSYATRFGLFADIGYSYLIVIFLIGLITNYLKNTYNQQKTLLENKAKQLKEANKTKDKLLSIIAHDLRSPLVSIQSYLELLNEYEFSNEEKKTMELELLSKTKNTEQLLSNLLNWTMNQMNGVKVKLVALNLKETIDPVLQIIQVPAREKGIEIDNLLPAAVFLVADQDMLQLIVRNLVNNAVKFTPPGGKVRVCCKTENQECKVMVTDNGVGIPPEQQATLFSLKTNSTYGTKQEKGTGLGLVLCKEFVELQNGSIGFESKKDIGTKVYFKLKMASQPENPADTFDLGQDECMPVSI